MNGRSSTVARTVGKFKSEGRSSTVAPASGKIRRITKFETILNVENDFGGRAGLQAGVLAVKSKGFSPCGEGSSTNFPVAEENG